nr:V-type immunoglobulin domain-containing suppressor of T-cell activation-like [Peromyscus maniculatus bairdii]
MGVPTAPEASGPRRGTLLLALFLAASRGPAAAAFKVATPYSLYVCPEGQNVTLTCRILGLVSKGQDVTFYKTWYLSSRSEVQVCKERRPIRNFTSQHAHPHHGSHQAPNTSHDQAQAHGLELASDHHGNFSITVRNVTLQDSGLYCCHVVEIRHHHAEHRLYGYMELQVQTGKDSPPNCTAYPSNEQESDSKDGHPHTFCAPRFCIYLGPRSCSGLSPQYHTPADPPFSLCGFCSPSASWLWP